MLRFLTAGESHGRGLIVVIEGIPAGLPLSPEHINAELTRRQIGYGRGERMKIEKDEAQILSGVRLGRTIGSPICLFIPNRDYPSWEEIMSLEKREVPPISVPRPGHADLPGALKYDLSDLRDVIERASARETTSRVAAGAIAKRLLKEFEIDIFSFVLAIGGVKAKIETDEWETIKEKAERSPLRCPDEGAEEEMKRLVDEAREKGDTLGGIFQVVATGVPVGLGSYVHWDRRLDARIAYAVLSIPSVKGVEIGEGFASAFLPGSLVHDEILYDPQEGFFRITNRAGGIEGGVTNGEPIIVRGAVKPIPTLGKPLHSVDMRDKKSMPAHKERADVCVVPSAGVIAEGMVAWILADAFLEKFGGDSLRDIKESFHSYLNRVRRV